MGQYYYTINIDKKEYIHPHKFGDGLKLMEFGLSEMGTMAGLAILLADGNGRGGGDIQTDPVSEVVGRWAGNRIVVAGDYADEGRFIKAKDLAGLVDKEGNPAALDKINLQEVAQQKFRDISYDVLFALMADSYYREEIMKGILKGRSSMDENIVKDFNLIHKQLAEKPGDMVLLTGRLKSNEGKTILEKFLKLDAKEKKEIKKSEGK